MLDNVKGLRLVGETIRAYDANGEFLFLVPPKTAFTLLTNDPDLLVTPLYPSPGLGIQIQDGSGATPAHRDDYGGHGDAILRGHTDKTWLMEDGSATSHSQPWPTTHQVGSVYTIKNAPKVSKRIVFPMFEMSTVTTPAPMLPPKSNTLLGLQFTYIPQAKDPPK